MNFTIQTLGTASAMPISDRNPSAQVLSVHGRLFLIDCGEGTQKQMRTAHVSFTKIEAVFISHIHGDHVFGLFGLLSSMSLYGRTAALDIYGPRALGSLINFLKSFYANDISFEIIFHQVDVKEPEVIHCSKNVEVSAFPLKHKIECYGYKFTEVLSPARPSNIQYAPRSYAYCSDTAPFPELAEWVKGVDVLYHEATYTLEYARKAIEHFHSTTKDAAECALAAGVGKLLIGHYSSRVRDVKQYQNECVQIFPDTFACEDLSIYEIGRVKSE